MRFQGNFKIALIAAVGILLLAAIAGAAVFALTLVQDTTEDTPAAVVGETAGAAVAPVQTVGSVASSPLDAEPAAANVAPPPPASVEGTRSTDGAQIAASWSAVAGATHYNLNFTYDNGTNWHRHKSDMQKTSVTITGAQRTKGYILAVQSVHKEGNQSVASGWKESDWIAGTPQTVESVTGARSENGEEIGVTWSVRGDATHYNLNYTNDDGASWHRYASDIPATDTTTEMKTDMTELEAQKAYIVAVQSVREVDGVKLAYGWTDSAKVHAPPGQPRDLSRTKHHNSYSEVTSITFRWTIPEFVGTGANTAGNKIKYNISCYINGSWRAFATGKTFTPIANSDPARYETTLTGWDCLNNLDSSLAGVAAINEVTGEASTLSLP